MFHGDSQKLFTCLLCLKSLELALMHLMKLIHLFLVSRNKLVFKATESFIPFLFHSVTHLVCIRRVDQGKAYPLGFHLKLQVILTVSRCKH